MNQSEQSLVLRAMVAEHTDRAVMILDPVGIIEWVNPGFTHKMGYAEREVIGKPFSFLARDGTGTGSSGQLIEQRIRAGIGADVDLLHYTKSGEPLWIRSEIRPVKDAGGTLQHFVALEVDLLEEELAARRVREDEERWMLALEVNDVAVFDMDLAARSLLGSRRWGEILGITSSSVSWDDFPRLRSLVHPDEMSSFVDGWVALTKGTIPSLSVAVRMQVGDSYRHMRLRARVARRNEAGEAVRIVGTMVDIHEATLMQLHAANASKLESIGELAAGIAHEINTPTQYVGDNVRFLGDAFQTMRQYLADVSQLLAQHAESSLGTQLRQRFEAADIAYLEEEIPKAIAQSLDGVDRIGRIVGAMREFSHPGQDQTSTDLNHAIANTITVATSEWKYVATVETEFDPSLPLVPVVPGEFNQVILNIIVNAAHAIGEAHGRQTSGLGTIRVRTRQAGDWAEIQIADDGCGMPPHVQQKIFDPFFTTKPVGKGTGQGLAIAHNVIVKKHRGTLAVDSESGRGTTFTIRLPLQADLSVNAA